MILGELRFIRGSGLQRFINELIACIHRAFAPLKKFFHYVIYARSLCIFVLEEMIPSFSNQISFGSTPSIFFINQYLQATCARNILWEWCFSIYSFKRCKMNCILCCAENLKIAKDLGFDQD